MFVKLLVLLVDFDHCQVRLVIPPSGSVRLARYSLPTNGVLVDRVIRPGSSRLLMLMVMSMESSMVGVTSVLPLASSRSVTFTVME